jgi:hypothetical protein
MYMLVFSRKLVPKSHCERCMYVHVCIWGSGNQLNITQKKVRRANFDGFNNLNKHLKLANIGQFLTQLSHMC